MFRTLGLGKIVWVFMGYDPGDGGHAGGQVGAEADIIPFVRYEQYDTQHKVPSNATRGGDNDRTIVTVGVNVPIARQFVVKADYQFRYDEEGADPSDLFSLGIGWVFE